MNMIKYTDESKDLVTKDNMTIPRGHRFWREMEIDKAEEVGEILPHDYKTPEQIQQELEAKEKVDAREYLLSTDFMTIREMEGGEPMPDYVKTKRAECRIILDGSLGI